MPWNRFWLRTGKMKQQIPVDSPPLRVLDAGGGNRQPGPGAQTTRLSSLISPGRCSTMRAPTQRLATVTDRIDTHAIDIHGLDKVFDSDQFDIVLCHNVIQFVDEIRPLLETLIRVLKPGGFLSLITMTSIRTSTRPAHSSTRPRSTIRFWTVDIHEYRTKSALAGGAGTRNRNLLRHTLPV